MTFHPGLYFQVSLNHSNSVSDKFVGFENWVRETYACCCQGGSEKIYQLEQELKTIAVLFSTPTTLKTYVCRLGNGPDGV